ncbi:glycosyl transferase [Rheinheimera fenheensis]|uniref:glycosyl transferase n=1 Tax=Rheinheimera fenheensis TaxID=3152295 RepID=UPI0032605A02
MSSSFNPVERTIARFLSRLPGLKRNVKRCYALVMYVLKRKGYKIKLGESIKRIEQAGENTFFGYYDKSPVNSDSSLVIYQKVNSGTAVKPSEVKDVSVCLSFFPSNDPILKLPSMAFNWQQGTKLQWLNANKFIFNDFDISENRYVSHIVDVNSREIVKTLQAPVYDCFQDKFSVTLSFERLAIYSPDYGYFAKNVTENELLPDCQDGIFYVCLSSGEISLFLSLQDIVNFEANTSMKNAKHTVNHLMISPEGKQFMFIHRWFLNGRRFDRLMVADIDSKKLKVACANGMVSHCYWLDENRVFSYLRGPEGQDSYWSISLNDLTFVRFNALEKFGDGHPHFIGNLFVTDTYPDKSRMQHLFLVDFMSHKVEHIGEFYHGFDFDAETRCDLHPRISKCGQFIFVDTVYNNNRQLCWLERAI